MGRGGSRGAGAVRAGLGCRTTRLGGTATTRSPASSRTSASAPPTRTPRPIRSASSSTSAARTSPSWASSTSSPRSRRASPPPSSKCFYFQSDHWRGSLVQDDPSTKTYEWDGHYFFDKARGEGGVWVTNFNFNGRTSDPSSLPGVPSEYARYFGPGTGGVITRNDVRRRPAVRGAGQGEAALRSAGAGRARVPGPQGRSDARGPSAAWPWATPRPAPGVCSARRTWFGAASCAGATRTARACGPDRPRTAAATSARGTRTRPWSSSPRVAPSAPGASGPAPRCARCAGRSAAPGGASPSTPRRRGRSRVAAGWSPGCAGAASPISRSTTARESARSAP